METIVKDVVILGGGPAGLTAGIYCARYNLNPLIIEKNKVGGKLHTIKHLDNYPGFTLHDGSLLADDIYQQVKDLKIEVEQWDILSIDIEDKITLHTNDKDISTKALIIATGVGNSVSKIKNEKKFIGKGVSYCATCDGMFYKGKTVAVNGNNDLAIQEALHLSHIVDKVYFICNDIQENEHYKLLENSEHVEMIKDSVVESVNGNEKVESITVDTNGNKQQLDVASLFPYDAQDSSLHFLQVFNLQNEQGFIKVDNQCFTGLPGVYAAGDICDKKLRQVSTAVSDGAIAALSVFEYVRGIK